MIFLIQQIANTSPEIHFYFSFLSENSHFCRQISHALCFMTNSGRKHSCLANLLFSEEWRTCFSKTGMSCETKIPLPFTLLFSQPFQTSRPKQLNSENTFLNHFLSLYFVCIHVSIYAYIREFQQSFCRESICLQ